jgi:type IV pilus assembly protein PilW
MKRAALFRTQIGLSLIELMVAITLGLMIIVSLGYILMGSRSTYRTQDASAGVQDTGRFALDYIGRQLRAAGRTDITPLASDGRVTFGDVPITGTATTLTVQYQLSDLQHPNAPVIPDCNGANFNAPNSINHTNGTLAGGWGMVRNTIALDNASPPNLTCTGNGGGGAQPVAAGVEEVQFLYTTGDGTWTNVPVSPVLAVQVCIRVRSLNNGVVNAGQTYNDCAGNTITPNDAYLRRTFSSVFALRNNISALPTP